MNQFQTKNIRRALVQRLRSLAQAGVEQLPRPSDEYLAALDKLAAQRTAVGRNSTAAEATPSEEIMARKRASSAPVAPQPLNHAPITSLPVLDADQRATALDTLRQQVANCVRCSELAATRTQTVFGVGNIQPRLCFFGEAPGADEDKQGIPFVGRAGQLLTDIIQKGMKLRREDVYILNVLKCRPPGNRNPLPDEVTNCRGYFERQLEILRPEFICCLGAVAAQNLLETTVSVGKLRGQFHDWRGIKVLVTYHPSYLLRNPSAKKYTWEDVQLLMSEMGID